MLLQVDTCTTAWVLAAICLVLIMTPGLALFYGGLLRKKNVISMFGYCLMAMVFTSLAWFLIGASFAFGEDIGGFIGGFSLAGLNNLDSVEAVAGIPFSVFITFQCMFAIITAAILASPFADRGKLNSFSLFIYIWVIIVYSPIAHWVWGDGGWLAELGALDFAGGTVVHVNVGFSALAVALVIGPRKGFQKEEMKPHNIPMVLTGLGILWFGWFGFNGGSALGANGVAGLAILNTNLAACAAAAVWYLIESKKTGKISSIGIATGVLAGLVGVTPAAGLVQPWAAVMMGGLTAVPVYYVVQWRGKSKLDESLDAFACHGVGGISGAILTGVFASANGGSSLITGDFVQFGVQVLGVIATGAYAFGVSYLLAVIVKKAMGLRVTVEEEVLGLDEACHGESCEEEEKQDMTAVNVEIRPTIEAGDLNY